MEWTHAWRVLSSLHGDHAAIDALYSANHSDALEAVHRWSESGSGVPTVVFDKMDEWFRSEASLLPVNKADVLHEGSPHGALHEQMVEKPNTPTMFFSVRNTVFILACTRAKPRKSVHVWYVTPAACVSFVIQPSARVWHVQTPSLLPTPCALLR